MKRFFTLFALFIILLSSSCSSTTEEPTLNKENNEKTLKTKKPQTEQERNAEIQAGANWLRNSKTEEKPQQIAPIQKNRDTEIASIMVSVSCAGNKGLIPRSQMGSMMKEMFQDKGIDSTEVYGNWDYYWGIAKQMDAANQTYCLK
jgi:hypothetical protein